MRQILLLIMLFVTLSVRAQIVWEDPRTTCPEREKIPTKSELTIPSPSIVAFNRDLEMPPAINQGNQGSCGAQAVAYYKGWLEAKEFGWDFTQHDSIENLSHQISPSYFYNMIHTPGTTPGVGATQVMRFIAQNGALSLAEFPYNEFDDTTRPGMELRYKGLEFRGKDDWYWVHDLNFAKYELLNHPLVTAIHNPSGSWHIICLTGYNDTIRDGNKVGAFRFINSAGKGWGQNGFGYYFYEDLPKYHPFYAMNDEPNRMPEKVYQVNFDWASNALGEIYEKCYAYFIKGDDTIKSIKFYPGLDEHFLLLDTAADADRLVMSTSYSFKKVNNKEYPVTNNFYGINFYNPLNNSLKPLQYTSELTQKIVDSVEVQPNWITYTLFSELKVTISLPTTAMPEITPFDLFFFNYPNPFRNETTFKLSFEKDEVVSLFILDSFGRQLQALAINKKFPSGEHLINFSADLPPGMYFARLTCHTCHNQNKTIKIMVID